MKQVITRAILASAIILGPLFVNAQIKGLLRDKAIDAISKGTKRGEEQKEEPKPESQPQEEEPQQKSKPGPSFMEQKMMSAMGFSNVKHEKQYSFTSSMVMEIEAVDSLKNEDKVLYTTYFNPNDKSYALVFDAVDRNSGKKQKSTIILDTKNWAMLILGDSEGEKSGVAMAIAPDSSLMASEEQVQPEETPADDFVHPFYTPTGNSKTLAGFNCKEYTYQNPEGKVNLWVTKDQKLNFSNAYSYMNGFQALASGGWAYGMGMVMEMVFQDSDSPASTHMIVKEILPNSPNNLDIGTYNIVGMGGAAK